jgi:hypothetical protein
LSNAAKVREGNTDAVRTNPEDLKIKSLLFINNGRVRVEALGLELMRDRPIRPSGIKEIRVIG